MEEILASIRRIIEESDTTRLSDVPPVPVNTDIPSRTAAPESKPADPYRDEEAELPPREGVAVAPLPPASFESPLGRNPSPLQSERLAQETAIDAASDQASPKQRAENQKAAFQAAKTAEDRPQAAPAPETIKELTLAEQMDVVEFNTPAPDVEPIAASPAASMHEDTAFDLERALEPMLSEATERQVSSAFDDLSFAVRNEQRRSFDEIAQEIMRPLLQDWLDNNLPTLVERLVREEIERVARGGRR